MPQSVLPLPGGRPYSVVAAAPGPGPHQWAGAPGATLDSDGSVVLAYRVRGEDDHNVIARSADGARFTTVAVLRKELFGASMVERPAIVRLDDGTWRLYVCCAVPGTPRWWIGALEAPTLEELPAAAVVPVFRGDDVTAVKDPVIRRDGDRWQAWICCHELDVPSEEDRMHTSYATSGDGLEWTWHGRVLAGRPGEWDARGARLTSVLPDGRALYDGRASKEENWFERTGVAAPAEPGRPGVTVGLTAVPDAPVVDVRYVEVLTLPDGGRRLYYEARLPDESHELRTELL
ncbi:hypothetical protein [Dactylosporangium sp. NPDC000521]|uniref:hypothetical protein n=1 Tax=Dactylosporangium sp. NPDC000521 TaxID=3363975 RepID=UPI0036CC0E37